MNGKYITVRSDVTQTELCSTVYSTVKKTPQSFLLRLLTQTELCTVSYTEITISEPSQLTTAFLILVRGGVRDMAGRFGDMNESGAVKCVVADTTHVTVSHAVSCRKHEHP